MVWLDVGGGTARNLEFLPVRVSHSWHSIVCRYILAPFPPLYSGLAVLSSHSHPPLPHPDRSR